MNGLEYVKYVFLRDLASKVPSSSDIVYNHQIRPVALPGRDAKSLRVERVLRRRIFNESNYER